MNLLRTIGVFMLLVSGCALAEHPSSGSAARFKITGQSRAYEVSVVALLAQPKELNGKFVRIKGYLFADWEGPIVFFSSEQCRNYSSFDGIGIEPSKAIQVDWNEYDNPNCRQVIAEGIYRSIRYKKPREKVVSLAIFRNVLEKVTYLAEVEQ